VRGRRVAEGWEDVVVAEVAEVSDEPLNIFGRRGHEVSATRAVVVAAEPVLGVAELAGLPCSVVASEQATVNVAQVFGADRRRPGGARDGELHRGDGREDL